MYYNPNTSKSLSFEDLKAFLNVSFPEGREQIQEWLLVHDNPPAEEGKIPVKSAIEMQDGIPIQTYILEEASREEPKEEIDKNILRFNQISSKLGLVENAIIELAAMFANLQVYCTTGIEEMKKASKDS